jgi:hypothetical protein
MIESKYDKVFKQISQQSEIYNFVKGKSCVNIKFRILDSVRDVVRGFNATIFAYGQTGSGKTYTMFGPHWDDNFGYQNTMGGLGNYGFAGTNNFLNDSSKFGIIPKAIDEIFIELSEKINDNPDLSFTVYCSFLQIYNEKLYDLFQDKEQSKPLIIREDKYSGIFVEGLSEYVVNSAQDCFVLLKRGEKNRITR